MEKISRAVERIPYWAFAVVVAAAVGFAHYTEEARAKQNACAFAKEYGFKQGPDCKP